MIYASHRGLKTYIVFVSDDLHHKVLNANKSFEVKSVNYKELTIEHSTSQFNSYIDLVCFDVFFGCCWACK